jgi:hypothetical protein
MPNSWLWLLIFGIDFFEGFQLDIVVELRRKIPECFGIHDLDTLWMSYGWMKFGNFELHLLIMHASWHGWGCEICFQNALWVAYNMVQFFFAIERGDRPRKWDSGMIWHMCMGHWMVELLMDEVCIFWTSSIDCACITSLMSKCDMFLKCRSLFTYIF